MRVGLGNVKQSGSGGLIMLLLLAWLLGSAIALEAREPAAMGMRGLIGWSPAAEMQSFEPDQLWEHINGAADLFLSYGFQGLTVMEISKDGLTVAVEFYDMGSPLNAFGIFRTEKSAGAEQPGIGAEAVIFAPYQCLLLEGRYYVKVEAVEGDIDKATGRRLLQTLADGLPSAGGLPPQLAELPAEGRVPGSERFRRLSFLGLGELSHCLYADYTDGDLIYQVFMVLPSPERTLERAWREIAEKWKEHDLPGGRILIREIPYRGPVGLLRTPEYLIGVAGVKLETVLIQLLTDIRP